MDGAVSGESDLSALKVRARTFMVLILGILVDLSFLVLWAGAEKLFELFLGWLGDEVGVAKLALVALEVIFDVSTLALVIAYISYDVSESIKRIWGKDE